MSLCGNWNSWFACEAPTSEAIRELGKQWGRRTKVQGKGQASEVSCGSPRAWGAALHLAQARPWLGEEQLPGAGAMKLEVEDPRRQSRFLWLSSF